MKRVTPFAFLMTGILSMNVIPMSADTGNAADVTPLLREYENSYTMQVLNPATFADWIDCSFDSKTAGYGSFYITAGEEPGTIVIPGFIEGKEEYKNVGIVDMDARTITFKPQVVYEESGYQYCLIKLPEDMSENLSTTMGVVFENAEPVIATFDEAYNITFNDWTYGVNYGALYPGMGVYPEYNSTQAFFTPKGNEAADVTPFLEEYNNSFTFEMLNIETYTDWVEASFNSEEAGYGSFTIKAGEQAGTIVIPDFINGWEGFSNVGVVDMENRTITFAPQVVYEEQGYPYCLIKQPAYLPDNMSTFAGVKMSEAEAVIATFDEQFNITFNDWTYGWDYSAFYPGMGMYPFYRNTTAKFTRKCSSVGLITGQDDNEVHYYDLQGREVQNNGNLPSNIYIRIQNGKAQKILIK